MASLKAKAKKKVFKDPDRMDFPTKAAYEKHEREEMEDEDRVERRLAKDK